MSTRWQTGLQVGKRLFQTGNALRKTGSVWLKNRDSSPAELARIACEDLGATYIKLGQLIASSPSLFPHEYVQSFQNCFDNAPAVAFDQIQTIIEQELGPNLSRYYQSIDPVPLATASIAQVHAAVLTSGERVVIKVQKPGVEHVLSTDFQLLEWSARLLERFNRKLPRNSVLGIVEEMRDGMLEECDFLKEADNLEIFADYLQQQNIEPIVVPKVFRVASNKRVLTMERLPGQTVSEYMALNGLSPALRLQLAGAMSVWMNSINQCDIYHADLHAGNIIIIDEQTLGFIDFGIVGHLDPVLWQRLMQLMEAGKARHYQQVAELLCQIGATNQHIDTAQLARDIEHIFTGAVLADNLMLELSQIAQQHGIRFPRAFTLLLKQLLYFDNFLNAP